MTEHGSARGRTAEDESLRDAPLAMDAATFRTLGHRLVDQLAEFLDAVPRASGDARRIAVGRAAGARSDGAAAGSRDGARPLLEQTARLLFDHSLFNGHPRFFGYITASPAPIGMLGDFLAAAVNPNVGAWTLSPAATEIEVADGAMDRGAHRLSRATAAGCSSAAATWRTSSAFWPRARRRPAGMCASTASSATRAAGSASTRRPRRTPGFRRPQTWRAWAPRRSAGSRLTQGCAWTSRRCGGRSTRTRPRAMCPASSSAPPARSARAPSIRCRRSARSARSTASGFTSTAPTAASRPRCLTRRTTCAR